jgi:hypothetical protein
MRKTALLIALAAGALVVPARAAAPTVTIAASPRIVVYGQAARLSGTVTEQVIGEQVLVLVRPRGARSFEPVASVEPSARGRWTTRLEPTIGTAVRASYAEATSATLTVRVRPRVSLRFRGGVFSVRVIAARSFRGRRALFQRRGPRGWRTLRRLVLADRPRRFSAAIPTPARVRVFVPLRRAVPGYASGWSKTVLVRRV